MAVATVHAFRVEASSCDGGGGGGGSGSGGGGLAHAVGLGANVGTGDCGDGESCGSEGDSGVKGGIEGGIEGGGKGGGKGDSEEACAAAAAGCWTCHAGTCTLGIPERPKAGIFTEEAVPAPDASFDSSSRVIK